MAEPCYGELWFAHDSGCNWYAYPGGAGNYGHIGCWSSGSPNVWYLDVFGGGVWDCGYSREVAEDCPDGILINDYDSGQCCQESVTVVIV